MNKKALIDTNILLDAAMAERPEHAHALMFLDEIAYGEINGLITATSLKDIYYVLSRYSNEASAREFVMAALDAFSLIGVDSTVCQIAVTGNESDFEDGIIRACAEQNNADFIISRDKEAFNKSTIRRLSAREYIEIFCEDAALL